MCLFITPLQSASYLLTPWCRVLLEKLIGLQLVKKFPAFQGTRKLITALTSLRHPFLPWASPIQSIYPHPTFWRSILILSTQLSLGLPSGLLPSGFPTKTVYAPLSSTIRATQTKSRSMVKSVTGCWKRRRERWDSTVSSYSQKKTFVNTAMNIRVPKRGGISYLNDN